jgi:hypothetical protein
MKRIELLCMGGADWKSYPETGWNCLLGYMYVYLYVSLVNRCVWAEVSKGSRKGQRGREAEISENVSGRLCHTYFWDDLLRAAATKLAVDVVAEMYSEGDRLESPHQLFGAFPLFLLPLWSSDQSSGCRSRGSGSIPGATRFSEK